MPQCDMGKQMDRADLRSLLEMAYYYAWGPAGDADKRDAWKKLALAAVPVTGLVYYSGNGEFFWMGP